MDYFCYRDYYGRGVKMDIITLMQEYGVYFAIPIVVAGLVQAVKRAFPLFFKSTVGMRTTHFIPVVLGAVFGLFLDYSDLGQRFLVGAALGCVSLLVYKFVTKSLASKVDLEDHLARKTMGMSRDV